MSINSMSGYGKGISCSDNVIITVEIKSVNHRFLDLVIRSPKQLNFADDIIREHLKNKGISRGHLDIFIQLEIKNQEEKLKLDYKVLDKYILFLEEINKKIKSNNIVNSTELLSFDGVITKDEEILNDEELKQVLIEALSIACDNLILMRKKEGERLVSDINDKILYIENIVSDIDSHSEDFMIYYREKLIDKINEVLDIDIDLDRINQEIVIYADKVGIDEEITRLKSHIKEYKKILNNEKSPIGKKIDYLTQELNRESNTISSKCSNIQISNLIVELKTTIEKIREQIQNIE